MRGGVRSIGTLVSAPSSSRRTRPPIETGTAPRNARKTTSLSRPDPSALICTSAVDPGSSRNVPMTCATPRSSYRTTLTSIGDGLSEDAVVGLPVLTPAPDTSGMPSHIVGEICFQTSIVGDALSALTAIVPVTGSQAKAARSPTASSRTCLMPGKPDGDGTQAETIACAGAAEPVTETWTHPIVGQNGSGRPMTGRGGAGIAPSVAVQPLRAIVPVVMPLLNSLEYTPD